MKTLMRFLKDESGATAIEYGLIVVLIVIGIIASLTTISNNFVIGPMAHVSSGLTSR